MAADYASWVGAFEEFFSQIYGIDMSRRLIFQGRAAPPSFRFIERKDGTPNLSHADKDINWWCTLAGWLAELARLLKQRQAGRAQSLLRRCHSYGNELPTTTFLPLPPWLRSKWLERLRTLASTSDGSIVDLAAAAQDNAHRAARAFATQSRAALGRWVLAAEAQKIGCLHRMVKDKPRVEQEFRFQGANAATSAQRIDAKAQTWAKMWQVDQPGRLASFDGLFRRAKQAVLDAEEAPLSEERLFAAIRGQSNAKAKGIDQLSKRDLLALPPPARKQLTTLFQ